MISMLAMAAMVSCTNEIENPDQPKIEGNEPVEIKLNAGIIGVETKAAISPTLTEDLKVTFLDLMMQPQPLGLLESLSMLLFQKKQVEP